MREHCDELSGILGPGTTLLMDSCEKSLPLPLSTFCTFPVYSGLVEEATGTRGAGFPTFKMPAAYSVS